jgi:NAD kinase
MTLTLDGQVGLNVDDQDVVMINTAKVKKVLLIKNPDRSYFETIREKFIFSKRD